MKKNISILLVLILSCSGRGNSLKKINASNLVINIPEEIILDKESLYKIILRETQTWVAPSGWGLELIVFGFSTGKEVFSLSEETGKVSNRIDRGKLNVLVKIKDGGKLRKIFFSESSGTTEKEMFEDLGRKIGRSLNQ